MASEDMDTSLELFGDSTMNMDTPEIKQEDKEPSVVKAKSQSPKKQKSSPIKDKAAIKNENEENDIPQEEMDGEPDVPDDDESREESEEQKEKKSTRINIRVKDNLNRELVFKVKPSTALKKIKEAYTERLKKNAKHDFRYRFNGEPVEDHATPESLGMEDDDLIDAFEYQPGG